MDLMVIYTRTPLQSIYLTGYRLRKQYRTASIDMKLIICVSLFALFATNSFGYLPKSSCYVKSKKCCYNFAKCSVKTHKTPDKYNCDFKTCAPKCTDSCHKVRTSYPKRVCAYKTVPVKKCEKHRKHHGWFGRAKYFFGQTHGHGEVKCSTKYIKKHVCSVEHKHKYKTKCKKVCNEICKVTRAVCTKTKTFESPVFCAKLSCDAENVSGSTASPDDVVGGPVLVNTSPSTKQIIGPAGDDSSHGSAGSKKD